MYPKLEKRTDPTREACVYAGDRQYHIRSISSYDVTAVTLSIIGLTDAFPVKLTTCFSVDGLPFQYQLDTVVDEPIDLRIEVRGNIYIFTVSGIAQRPPSQSVLRLPNSHIISVLRFPDYSLVIITNNRIKYITLLLHIRIFICIIK